MSTLEPVAVSPKEAAAYLSISKRALSKLIASGQIAASNIDRCGIASRVLRIVADQDQHRSDSECSRSFAGGPRAMTKRRVLSMTDAAVRARA